MRLGGARRRPTRRAVAACCLVSAVLGASLLGPWRRRLFAGRLPALTADLAVLVASGVLTARQARDMMPAPAAHRSHFRRRDNSSLARPAEDGETYAIRPNAATFKALQRYKESAYLISRT